MIVRFFKWLGFHVHEWSQWQDDAQIVSTVHKGVIGTTQERRCSLCGERQSKRIWMG